MTCGRWSPESAPAATSARTLPQRLSATSCTPLATSATPSDRERTRLRPVRREADALVALPAAVRQEEPGTQALFGGRRCPWATGGPRRPKWRWPRQADTTCHRHRSDVDLACARRVLVAGRARREEEELLTTPSDRQRVSDGLKYARTSRRSTSTSGTRRGVWRRARRRGHDARPAQRLAQRDCAPGLRLLPAPARARGRAGHLSGGSSPLLPGLGALAQDREVLVIDV